MNSERSFPLHAGDTGVDVSEIEIIVIIDGDTCEVRARKNGQEIVLCPTPCPSCSDFENQDNIIFVLEEEGDDYKVVVYQQPLQVSENFTKSAARVIKDLCPTPCPITGLFR